MPGRVCASILQRVLTAPVSSQGPQLSLFNYPTQHGQHCHLLSSRINGTAQTWTTSRTSHLSFVGKRSFSTRQDLDFQLSQVQINSILRSNEQSVSVPEFDGRGLCSVRKFESNQLAANSPNEDRRSAVTCLQSKGMLFGVFDGHGGWTCAQAICERLLYYIAVAMMPKHSLEEMDRCVAQGRAVPPILQWYKHHSDYNYRDSAALYIEHLRVFWQELLENEEYSKGMSPPDALDLAFRRLDADISLEAQLPLTNSLLKSTAIQVAFAGSTACVAHVGPDVIHVANAGDCRAVLGVQEEDGSWSALPLSSDHNSQNPSEVQRIRAQHPSSERDTVLADDRLLGMLMPLRAFGDVRFKWSVELQQSVMSSLDSSVDVASLNLYNYVPPSYKSPPYLDVTPEITGHKLRPQDRFLILGSDGLWDELSNHEAVQLVGEHLSGIHLQAPVSQTERKLKLGKLFEVLQKRRARASPALDTNAAPTSSATLWAGTTTASCVRRGWPPCSRSQRTLHVCTGTISLLLSST
uniref:Putative pyruvate dehydrogenase phosphatase isoenzyme 2 n=1 Tax=Neogobius melanostomus TaxID=47308 RepID=A0A8C6URS6_9GOBI